MNNTENNEPQLLNINGLFESMKVISTTLNKSCKSGVFDSVDEAYIVRISLNNIETALKSLEQHQTAFIKNKNEKKEQI